MLIQKFSTDIFSLRIGQCLAFGDVRNFSRFGWLGDYVHAYSYVKVNCVISVERIANWIRENADSADGLNAILKDKGQCQFLLFCRQDVAPYLLKTRIFMFIRMLRMCSENQI